VRLDVRGKETELDKGIVDVLGEPLLHIIRNAVDHGLEPPDERLASGKSEEGVVTLRAYHEAAQIVVEVSDDGRGLSVQRLKEKARREGHLSSEEYDRLSDREAADLIFISGLSTAEEVSDVSGRGVGMDAVREAVEQMKGSVEVETEPGRGTTFRIRLPLTLAVIRSLLIRVGSKSYAIPISSVAEVVRVRADEIQTVGGQSTIVLREKCISCIDLHGIFGAPAAETDRRFVLILALGARRVGLPVDQLLGQQELVIKAVDRHYVAADLVKGASILGDGRVIFILDVPALFRRAVEFVRAENAEAYA
jgi:two-component system chemotaxis sensor kinase CheA